MFWVLTGAWCREPNEPQNRPLTQSLRYIDPTGHSFEDMFYFLDPSHYYEEVVAYTLRPYIDEVYCEMVDKAPDYVNVSIGGGQGEYGFSAQFNLDRYGNVYRGFGPAPGVNKTKISAAATFGWMNVSQNKPYEKDLKRFLEGDSTYVGSGYWAGTQSTYSGDYSAYEYGVITPSVYAGAIYSEYLFNIGITW